ncbi:MAG: tRNA (adenosine(37)-N6)-threonylcarbamoyltransferase complex transferase subunit TsaD [Pseudomonadota bacterium]
MLILGIDTSCDETAAAVVRNGSEILSNIVASQFDIHHKYGGIVPELASRKHIECILPVVTEAIDKAQVSMDSLDGVAVTAGPGLVGALLVGLNFAKAFSYARVIPLVGVNHLEAHVSAIYLSDKRPDFPFICLLASGGHTIIFYVKEVGSLEVMGQTRDDAAGEAFDKAAKILGLGYPGGRLMDELSQQGDPERITFPRAYMEEYGLDFSFSGVKAALVRYLNANHPAPPALEISDIAAGFQQSIIDVLVKKSFDALEQKQCARLAIVGGVASNTGLRRHMESEGARRGVSVFIPKPVLCTDNAAMVAAAGFYMFLNKKTGALDMDAFSTASARRQRI